MNQTYNQIIYLFFITLFLFKGGERCAQLKKSDIDKVIEISTLEHPYLYFNDAEKKQLIDRIKTDQESKDVFNKIRAMAKVWMAMPVDKNIPIQGKNTRADWSEEDRSRKYSDYYNNNRNNAFYLSFLYLYHQSQVRILHWLDL